MKQIGPGILHESEIYFCSPSEKAKKLYYNVLCAGHFYCDSNYHLIRNSYESVLILHVADGTFTFRNHKGDFTTAKKNDTVILDCHKPHEYYTNDSLESLWIHITGADSRKICRELIDTNEHIIKNDNVKKSILSIISSAGGENTLTEAELSVEIYRLLIELLSPTSSNEKRENQNNSNIQLIKDYISLHLSDSITVDELARISHMSSTHFSRVFKEKTGVSPYNYILTVRLNKSKELLLKTDMSVTEIAYETGFNSESNFVYCFKSKEGISPGKFRKLNF